MRIEELQLETGAGPMAIRFDRRITVFGPLARPYRRALIDTLVAAAAGTTPGTVLRYADTSGRQIVTGPNGPLYLDDRSPVDDAEGGDLSSGPLLTVGSADLGLPTANESAEDLAMADAARAACDQLSRQLRNTSETNATADRIHAELLELNRRSAQLTSPSGHLVGLLARRKAALERRLAQAESTDVNELRRRLSTMTEHLAECERRLAAATTPSPAELSRRLLDLIGRSATHGPDDFLSLLLDEPLALVPVDQRVHLLDLLFRLSARVQLIYVSDDPVVLGWAREQIPGIGISVMQPV